MEYKEYIKQRFAEMKDDPEYKGMKPAEKTSIIASEWANREEKTVIEEVRKPNQEEEKSSENEQEKEETSESEEDKESKYKYKCECGHYFNEIPISGKCPNCGVELV